MSLWKRFRRWRHERAIGRIRRSAERQRQEFIAMGLSENLATMFTRIRGVNDERPR